MDGGEGENFLEIQRDGRERERNREVKREIDFARELLSLREFIEKAKGRTYFGLYLYVCRFAFGSLNTYILSNYECLAFSLSPPPLSLFLSPYPTQFFSTLSLPSFLPLLSNTRLLVQSWLLNEACRESEERSCKRV